MYSGLLLLNSTSEFQFISEHLQPSVWLTLPAVGQSLACPGYEVPSQAALKVLAGQYRKQVAHQMPKPALEITVAGRTVLITKINMVLQIKENIRFNVISELR